MPLADRHIVVTGGTGHLGRAVVAKLLKANATVHVPNNDERELKGFRFADHPRVVVKPGIDLADEQRVATFYGGIDKLWASIHLAGGFGMSPVEKITLADFERMMEMNATTCFLCCREAVAAFRRAKSGGRIVNVAARPALEPRSGAGMTAYASSKATVAALTLALAQEVANEGVLVNAIAPSIIDTPPNRAAMPKADHDSWAKPEDIAETIYFLVSPENAVTRGAIVPVYGKS